MDHNRLSFSWVLVVAFALLLPGCASKKGPPPSANSLPRGIYHSSYTPIELSQRIEKFLVNQKGYRLLIRKPSIGMYATAWRRSNPSQRHQINLRILDDENGSLLSAHIITQSLGQKGWQKIPNSGRHEDHFIEALKDYLNRTTHSGIKPKLN